MSDRDVARLAAKAMWDEADARAVLDAWRSSGESKAAFARRTGINEQRLHFWTARLRSAARKPVRFHPVRVTNGDEASGAIEIHVHGHRVVARPGVRAEDLRAVLSAIRELAAC